MADLDRTKLRRLDLTLLLVLLGLLRHRRATLVAAELGLTGSSVSHALGRLRSVFGDELFLRRPHGLEPTAFALAVEPEVRAAVEALDGALRGPRPFDPATSTAGLRISARDHEVGAVLAPALARVRAEAPGIVLSLLSEPQEASLRLLREGGLDLAVGFYPRSDPDLLRRPLRSEGYLVVLREGHPLLGRGADPEAFAAADHVLVSPFGATRGVVDAALARRGLARRVVLTVPQFFLALALMPGTDLVATLPATFARAHAPRFGLALMAPPVPLRPFEISALHHRRDARNPAVGWLLGLLAEPGGPAA